MAESRLEPGTYAVGKRVLSDQPRATLAQDWADSLGTFSSSPCWQRHVRGRWELGSRGESLEGDLATIQGVSTVTYESVANAKEGRQRRGAGRGRSGGSGLNVPQRHVSVTIVRCTATLRVTDVAMTSMMPL